ncbi:MAG: cupin domain-containing protein [Candidatus Thorarchaeota archaeon]|jgi:mannose-6-phosphate isomerase-like protein (cupin superfamily)
MRIYRKADSPAKGRMGYSACYVADITLSSPADSTGVILVEVPKKTKTEPHAHSILEEVFIVMNRTRMGVGNNLLELEAGDVVVADPGEPHWFESYEDEDVTLIALKIPNLKNDKVTPSND